MLALLETEIYAPTGREKRTKAEKDVSFTEGKILGMDILYGKIRLPKKISSRRTEKRFSALFDSLTRAGADGVCFKSDFLFRERIEDAGFYEPDIRYLWRKKAAEIAEKSSDRRNMALIASDSMTDGAESACVSLCGSYRGVALYSEKSMAAFCRRLCEKTGVSVLEKPGRAAVKAADTAIIYDCGCDTELGEDCTAIFMGARPKTVSGMGKIVSACDFSYCGSRDFSVREGYDGNAILAAALKRGKCDASDIKVEKVERKRTLLRG